MKSRSRKTARLVMCFGLMAGLDRVTRKLYYYRSTGSGTFAARVQIGQGW